MRLWVVLDFRELEFLVEGQSRFSVDASQQVKRVSIL